MSSVPGKGFESYQGVDPDPKNSPGKVAQPGCMVGMEHGAAVTVHLGSGLIYRDGMVN